MTGFLPENPSALILHISVSIFVRLLLLVLVFMTSIAAPSISVHFIRLRLPKLPCDLCFSSLSQKKPEDILVMQRLEKGCRDLSSDDELCEPRTLLIIPVLSTNTYIVLRRRLRAAGHIAYAWYVCMRGRPTTRHHPNLLAILLCSSRIRNVESLDDLRNLFTSKLMGVYPITHMPCMTAQPLPEHHAYAVYYIMALFVCTLFTTYGLQRFEWQV